MYNKWEQRKLATLTHGRWRACWQPFWLPGAWGLGPRGRGSGAAGVWRGQVWLLQASRPLQVWLCLPLQPQAWQPTGLVASVLSGHELCSLGLGGFSLGGCEFCSLSLSDHRFGSFSFGGLSLGGHWLGTVSLGDLCLAGHRFGGHRFGVASALVASVLEASDLPAVGLSPAGLMAAGFEAGRFTTVTGLVVVITGFVVVTSLDVGLEVTLFGTFLLKYIKCYFDLYIFCPAI